MPSITGIELGPDSCVLVRARPHAGGAEISAFHVFERSEWPSHDTAVVAALRGLRRAKGFPRRARVVAWGLTEPVTLDDAVARLVIKPIVAAGFRVDAVLTAPEALAEIARTRPRGRGVAAVWLALNVHGAAIAIVRDGDLLFGRTFEWNYTPGVVGTRAELLQRYSLVAHLAPEVNRGITLVKRAHGAIVEAVVTCGDLPELRSLTMPLIEELDLEVETLDSTEGLCATVKARLERLVESAPAVRLATAAATAPIGVARRPTSHPWLRIAAAAVILATLGWRGYVYWNEAPARPVAERIADTRPTAPAVTAGISPAPAAQVSAAVVAPPVSAPEAQPSPPATAVTTMPPPVVTTPAAPVSKTEVASQKPPPSVEPRAPAAPKPQSGESGPKPQSSAASTAQEPKSQSSAVSKTQEAKPQSSAVSTPPELKPQDREGGSKPQAAEGSRATQPPSSGVPVDTVPLRIAPPAIAPAPVQRPVAAVTVPATEPATQAPPSSAPVAEPPPPRESTPVRADTSRRPRIPLKEAVPTVDSILISQDRRIALVGGRIVTVGDRVGSRIVAGIEGDMVVLQEPSGYRIFVRIRRRPGLQ